MNRVFYVGVANLCVLGSAFASLYWLAPFALQVFGISEYANGVQLLPLLVICILSVVVGCVFGLFLFPAVLRPFVAPSEFWHWLHKERSVDIPILSPLLNRWSTLLYGKSAAQQGAPTDRPRAAGG